MQLIILIPCYHQNLSGKIVKHPLFQQREKKRLEKGSKGLKRRGLTRVKNLGAKVRLRLGFWN